MPLLGGLFSRKNKASPRSKRDAQVSSIHSTLTSELDSNLSSPTASYVTVVPDRLTPSSPNARNLLHPDSAIDVPQSHFYAPMVPPAPTSSSGNRLRLPFGRKKSAISGSDVAASSSPDVNTKALNGSSQPIFTTRASTSMSSEEDRRLRPPPSRSAIFAAYTDSNSAMSTRSLPNKSTLTVLDTPASPSPSTTSTKRPSIFPWSKSSSSTPPRSHPKSATLPPASVADTDSPRDESFNLKSFRHVRPPSPTHSIGSNTSLSTPIPRPRGASINSEASQRISVAVFREVQARRSLAGSPSLSLRSPSPAPALPQASGMVAGRNSPRPSRSSPHISQTQARRSTSIPASDSDEDSSAETDSEDETLNQRRATRSANSHRSGKGRAMSELGHGQSIARQPEPLVSTRAPKYQLGHSFIRTSQVPLKSAPEPKLNQSNLPPGSQSNLSQYGGGFRQRAAVSTSALSPSPAAKRASILVSENAGLGSSLHNNDSSVGNLHDSSSTALSNAEQTKLNTAFNRSQTNVAQVSNTGPDSHSDSEDDAPLASLVGPRRPGSAMSAYSNVHSRSAGNVSTRSNARTQRPLIDIRDLTGTKGISSTFAEKSMTGFTDGPTLLSDTKLTMPRNTLVESPLPPPISVSPQPLTSIVPPVKFISPPGSPVKELKQLISSKDLGDRGVRNASSHTIQRAPSPERRRDLLTDRLTRAVTRSLSPTNDRSSSSSNSQSSRSNNTINPASSGASTARRQPVNRAGDVVPNSIPSVKAVDNKHSTKVDSSPPDQDLAQLLGAAAKFISRNGESPEESSESEEDDSCQSEGDSKPMGNNDGIAPIPIKKRFPPPAFAVTSRPSFPKHNASQSTQITEANEPPLRPRLRPRSITLMPPSSSFGNSASSTAYPQPATHGNGNGAAASPPIHSNASIPKSDRADLSKPAGVRQRSSTMITSGPLSVSQLKPFPAPEKPFVTTRRNSPASSTGDSSSGRAPLTPRDGSDIGLNERRNRKERSGGTGGLNVKNHIKHRSVSFEEDLQDAKMATLGQVNGTDSPRSSIGNIHTRNEEEREERRRERRRTEAKAAIELGNVINGRGPIITDHDDMGLPANQMPNPRSSMFNPMMAMGGPMQMPMGFGPGLNSSGWAPNMQQPMLSPAQFMIPPPAETQFLAAHQHAMMIAKHAYQMAVAQQAMAAAADEWERGSAIGGFSGSVYGGSTNTSMVNPQFGMMGGMMQGAGGWSSGSSVYLPSSSRSMYGGGSSFGAGGVPIASSRSEYGGIGASDSANWSSSKSSYGEAFGPSSDRYGRKGPQGYRRAGNDQRDSSYLPPVPPIPASQGQSGQVGLDGRAIPRPRTGSQSSSTNRGPAALRKVPPPSSWKAGT